MTEQPARSNLAKLTGKTGPVLLTVLFASAAHAQGTIDFTQATTVFTTIKTFVVAIGALFVVMGLIFAAVRMMGGRMAEGAMGIVAALIGGLVIGLGPGWVNTLSGQVTQ